MGCCWHNPGVTENSIHSAGGFLSHWEPRRRTFYYYKWLTLDGLLDGTPILRNLQLASPVGGSQRFVCRPDGVVRVCWSDHFAIGGRVFHWRLKWDISKCTSCSPAGFYGNLCIRTCICRCISALRALRWWHDRLSLLACRIPELKAFALNRRWTLMCITESCHRSFAKHTWNRCIVQGFNVIISIYLLVCFSHYCPTNSWLYIINTRRYSWTYINTIGIPIFN